MLRALQYAPPSKDNGRRRIAACLLLLAVVALLVVNPLWECRDHLDNLRHLGPNGFLALFLLFACAGITLFRSLPWRRPSSSRLPALSLKAFSFDLSRIALAVVSTPADLSPLPLRI